MALSDDTKNDLKGMVATIRERLTNEFTKQLQELYGIQPDGEIADVEDLGLVDEEQRTVAEQLRESIDHYAGGPDASEHERQEAIQRTIREQAFTVLNRFAALRLAEERDLVSESVGSGFDSAGFRVYDRVAGSSLGETTYDRYHVYIECLFDELALDLGVLFDRYAPEGLLFPREEALEDLLDALNQEDVQEAWMEDETIGWIYQYFHPKSERKEMRDESSTPRNSREMAVRNQLFTPRYVVEFLVDNSLGRYWHEMTEGETDLTDDLDYFVPREKELFLGEDEDPPEDPDEDLYVAPYRDLKDPREIRLLDPACGSMHFGLYAFDLFEQIYAEAWDRYPEIRASLQEDLGLEAGDREAFLREVPRLIVEHNLYGIDIDRRAAQIAGLALWLRAQRAWSERDVAPAERPRIRQSGIVCAESMPGEADLLEAYVEKLEAKGPDGRLLGDLVREIWDRMQIAGEAGPLLKIEREIEDVLDEARRQFEEIQKRKERDLGTQGVMFDDLKQSEQGKLQFDISGVEERFFEHAESLLLDALQTFAAESTEGTDYGRRLFADDAERGFDFLELMHDGSTTGFDVVVMNPPFGNPSEGAKDYIDDKYPNTKNDVYQAFVDRVRELSVSAGYVGAITSRNGFYLTNSQRFRERVILDDYKPHLFLDLGSGVLDATVEVVAYTLRTLSNREQRKSVVELLNDLERTETTSTGKFSVPKYMEARGYNPSSTLDRPVAEEELRALEEEDFIVDVSGRYPQFKPNQTEVETARSREVKPPMSPEMHCFRLLEVEDKKENVKEIMRVDDQLQFKVKTSSFESVPESPFSYWVSDTVHNIFSELKPFGTDGRSAQVGLQTSNDFRFVRCWWEVDGGEVTPPDVHPENWSHPYCVKGFKWFNFAKGGRYSPYFSDLHLVVKWEESGREIKEYVTNKYPYLNGNPDYVVKDRGHYFRPGMTWSRRSQIGLSMRSLPKGSVFADKGPVAFIENIDNLTAYLALWNSEAILGLADLQMSFGSFEAGVIERTPIPEVGKHELNRLQELSQEGIDAQRRRREGDERTHVFSIPELIRNGGEDLSARLKSTDRLFKKLDEEIYEVKRSVDELSYDLYEIPLDDQEIMHRSVGNNRVDQSSGEDEEIDDWAIDSYSQTHNLVSYLIGVAFGRFDIRYATGEKDIPDLSSPFDPLPICPPGMLTDDAGLPRSVAPNDYPISFPSDGILADDRSRTSLIRHLRRSMELILGVEEANYSEEQALNILGFDTLGSYIRDPNGFFDDHKSRYSKSRRRAPIYWPLQTPSREYTLWIYYPYLDAQTLYTCVNDYITPKLENEVRPELGRLREKVQSGETDAREELSRLETLEQELEEMREELLRVAELPYEPNQNDGVELTAAPLHNLFQHTSWSDRLEGYWEELQAGEYDWAHIAHSIWPDRVEDACRENKSIAIAHDREVYEGD
jgi:hypothetical protein